MSGKYWKDPKDNEGLTPKQVLVDGIENGVYLRFLQQDAEANERNANLSFLENLKVVEAEKPTESTCRVLYRFPVLHTYLNPSKTLHGGQAAAMFDVATSCMLAIIRKPGFWFSFGVSRTLNVTFIKPAVEGDILLMDCEVVSAGKRLCLIRANLIRESDRALIMVCEHQKYNVDADMPKV